MEELIKRVQEQLDNNWAVDKKDIQRLINGYIMQNEFLGELGKFMNKINSRL